MDTKQTTVASFRNPWWWVPTLYFAQGIPYFVVNNISVMMFTKMGVPNGDMSFFTTLLYFPWFLKGVWSPIVDVVKTKRWWIITMQILMTAAMVLLTLTLPHPDPGTIASESTSISIFTFTLVVFIITAFASATHDIAADGFYIKGLDEKDQALFVGIRSTAYRIGMIFCQGAMVVLAGWLEMRLGISLAWSITMALLAAVMILLALWHYTFIPRIESSENSGFSESAESAENKKSSESIESTSLIKESVASFVLTIKAFINKPQLLAALFFILLFRFPEAQLAKMAQPFMLRPLEEGGLNLGTIDVGVIYGTVGVIALLVGGILGGFVVSLHGLKRWWWPMILAISVPDLVYIYFAAFQPSNSIVVCTGVALEQLGYGFGFTAYSLFLVYFSRGERSTSVFSICTGLQALGMMLPGMIAGWMADALGFVNFFIWVALCCVVTFVVSAFVKVEAIEKK